MEIIFLLANIVLTFIAIPMVIKMFLNNNIVALNYKKENIPICLGIVFIFIQIITLSLYVYFTKSIEVGLYLFGLLVTGFIGLLDDLAGDVVTKGLKGHIKAFFKGELTTGFIKAAAGFFISLIIAMFISKDILNIVLNTFLIALSINALNLFDLRPGRALKVFILFGLIFLLLDRFKNPFIILSLLLIALVYFPYDIKAKTMMGDTGSNVLGFTLGYFSAINLNIYIRLAYLIVLIGLHIISEKSSISRIIERNKILSFIDKLGR